jgi:hypothetical protein
LTRGTGGIGCCSGQGLKETELTTQGFGAGLGGRIRPGVPAKAVEAAKIATEANCRVLFFVMRVFS